MSQFSAAVEEFAQAIEEVVALSPYPPAHGAQGRLGKARQKLIAAAQAMKGEAPADPLEPSPILPPVEPQPARPGLAFDAQLSDIVEQAARAEPAATGKSKS